MMTTAISTALSELESVNDGHPHRPRNVCFQTVSAALPQNTQGSGRLNRGKLQEITANLVANAGIVLAVPWAVRLTVIPDEHTTIAIQRAEPSDRRTTVTVPLTGVELIAVERALIRFALDLHGGNRTHAASFLGLSRSALLYRMQKYHLDLTPRRLLESEEQS